MGLDWRTALKQKIERRFPSFNKTTKFYRKRRRKGGRTATETRFYYSYRKMENYNKCVSASATMPPNFTHFHLKIGFKSACGCGSFVLPKGHLSTALTSELQVTINKPYIIVFTSFNICHLGLPLHVNNGSKCLLHRK